MRNDPKTHPSGADSSTEVEPNAAESNRSDVIALAPLRDATIGVRPVQPTDRRFILELAARFGTTRAAWRGYDEVVDGTRRRLADALDQPCASDAMLVAADGAGRQLGFAWVVCEHDFFTGEAHGHISEIATVADGDGAGSALMDASERWARERGFRYLSLNVNDANEAARRFYERRDYVPEYRHLVKLISESESPEINARGSRIDG